MKWFVTLMMLGLGSSLLQAQDDAVSSLVEDYERIRDLTLAYIEAMPEDKFDYKPTEDMLSFSEQMLHLAQGTAGLTGNGTGQDRLYNINMAEADSLKNKEDVTRVVTEAMNYAIAGVKEMNPETFNEVIERGPFKVTRIGWVYKALEHLVHHRGQCVVYLRMVGVTPPGYKLF